MKWQRLTVNLDDRLAGAAKARAKGQRRSFAAYVATLIEADIKKSGVEEDPATYGDGPAKSAPALTKPPDKSQRHRGDGPHRKVS